MSDPLQPATHNIFHNIHSHHTLYSKHHLQAPSLFTIHKPHLQGRFITHNSLRAAANIFHSRSNTPATSSSFNCTHHTRSAARNIYQLQNHTLLHFKPATMPIELTVVIGSFVASVAAIIVATSFERFSDHIVLPWHRTPAAKADAAEAKLAKAAAKATKARAEATAAEGKASQKKKKHHSGRTLNEVLNDGADDSASPTNDGADDSSSPGNDGANDCTSTTPARHLQMTETTTAPHLERRRAGFTTRRSRRYLKVGAI